MGFEVDLIRLMQSGSNAFSDYLFLIITYFGDEMFFMIVAIGLFWFFDKRYAFRLANIYLLSAVVVEGLKNIFCRPRPYNAYSHDVRSIFSKTGGYSFPSGHSHSIANLSTQLSLKFGKKADGTYRQWVYIVAISLTVLVMISRMYLGQHYLSDVLTGAFCGIAHVFLLTMLFDYLGDKDYMFAYVGIGISVVMIIVIACVPSLGYGLASGIGAFGAFSLGYLLERKFVGFDPKSNRVWWKIACRIILGVAVLMAIKESFKLFLPSDIPVLYSTLRYFIVGLWATFAAPALFKVCKI